MKFLVLLLFSNFFQSIVNAKVFSPLDPFNLRFGIGVGATYLESSNNENELLPNFGFTTSFGPRWRNWEAGLTSFITISPLMRKSQFESQGQTISGEGHTRSVAFGPRITYHSDIEFKNSYLTYFGGSYLWSLKTFKFEELRQTSANFDDERKLTLQGSGFALIVGIEEQIEARKHPIFFELSAKMLQGDRLKIIGGTSSKVETLSKENTPEKIQEWVLAFYAGMTLF